MDGLNELLKSFGFNGLRGSNGSLSRSTSVPGSNQDNAIQSTNQNKSQVPIETGIPLESESPQLLGASTVGSFVYKSSLSMSSPEFGTLFCDSMSNQNSACPGLTINVFGGTISQNISYGGAVFSVNINNVFGTTTSFPKPEDTIVSIEPKIWTPFQPTTISASNQIFVICNFSRLLEIHKSSSENNINDTFVRFIIQAIGTASLVPMKQVSQPEYIPTDNQTVLINTLNQNLLKYVAERNANMDFVRTFLDAIAIAASKDWGFPDAVDNMLCLPEPKKDTTVEFTSPTDPLIEPENKVPIPTYPKQDSVIYIHMPIEGNGHTVKLETSGIGTGKKKGSLWKRVWNFVKPVFVCGKCLAWCV